MALYSHTYKLKTRGREVKGDLQFKSGQTFSTTTKSSTDFLTSTQITAIGTFLTALSTLKTALGEFESFEAIPTSTQDVGKV